MDSHELAQQKALIEDKLNSLQQSVSFLYQDYDYHHKNNELEIMQEQLFRLLKANEDLKKLNDAYEELISKIEIAKEKRKEIMDLLKMFQEDDFE